MKYYIEIYVSSNTQLLSYIAKKLSCDCYTMDVGDEFESRLGVRHKKISCFEIKSNSLCSSTDINEHCKELLSAIKPILEDLHEFRHNDEYSSTVTLISEGKPDPDDNIEMRLQADLMAQLCAIANEIGFYADA